MKHIFLLLGSFWLLIFTIITAFDSSFIEARPYAAAAMVLLPITLG